MPDDDRDRDQAEDLDGRKRNPVNEEPPMIRVTLRMPVKHVDELDELAAQGEFPNRSEAVRDFVRNGLRFWRQWLDDVDDDGRWI